MIKKDGMYLCIFFIAAISIIGTTIANNGISIHNPVADMTATSINEVEAYDVEYVYNNSIPSTADPLTLVEGVNGLDYTYDGLNYTHLSDKINAVVQIGTGAQGIYYGRMTGYGPDCPGCSLVGNVTLV